MGCVVVVLPLAAYRLPPPAGAALHVEGVQVGRWLGPIPTGPIWTVPLSQNASVNVDWRAGRQHLIWSLPGPPFPSGPLSYDAEGWRVHLSAAAIDHLRDGLAAAGLSHLLTLADAMGG